MIRRPWIYVNAVILTMIFQPGETDDINDDLTCVMAYKNWTPTSLKINWTLPSLHMDLEDLNLNITWYTMYNIGPCPGAELTSCTWIYGNGMSFDPIFNLSVIMTVKKTKVEVFNREWIINPYNCRKPPTLDHVVSETINSTCMNLRWWYSETSKCSIVYDKFYQISYREKDDTEFKVNEPPDNKDLVTSCNSSRIMCNLHPFTTYIFNVQTILGDDQWRIRGYLSDSRLGTCTTQEDVPAGAPEMSRGGFSILENRCASENTRTLRIFWKDVSKDLKNGIITHFIMDIQELSKPESEETKSIKGEHFNCLVTLKCDLKYEIRLRAETSVGVSTVISSLSIPEITKDFQSAIKDVVPVIANESFHVYWLEDTESNGTRSEEYRVFWCLKDILNLCVSPINWTTVSKNFSYANVPVQHGSPPQNFRFGVGYDDIGITWADCHYTDTEDLRPPVGLKFDSSHDGSLTLHWDNVPCESHPPRPYINHFVVSFCEVIHRNDKICSGLPYKTIVDGRGNSNTFPALKRDSVYMACVQSVDLSRTHVGNMSCVTGQTKLKDSVRTKVLVIVVCVTIVFLISVAFAAKQCKKCLKEKWLSYDDIFRITIPKIDEENEEGSRNSFIMTDSSQKPLLA